jgi:hypothetical protein
VDVWSAGGRVATLVVVAGVVGSAAAAATGIPVAMADPKASAARAMRQSRKPNDLRIIILGT